MKRFIGLILVLSLLLTGCSVTGPSDCLDHLPGECPECREETPVVNPTPSPDNSAEQSGKLEEEVPGDSGITDEPGEETPEGGAPESGSQGGDNENIPEEGGEDTPPSHTHSYQASVTLPSCLTEGYTTYTCAGCGDSYVADRTDAKGHGYNKVTVAPTCETDGYTEYSCTACGDSYKTDEVGATGHSYGKTTVAPSCDTEGYTAYSCSGCGDFYIADRVDAKGHDYKSAATEPDCENGGYTTYTCTTCNYSYKADEVEALGHNYKATTTAPTCVSGGYVTYTCAVCGDSYTGNQTAAKGHSYNTATVAPTCLAEGYTTHTCTDCGYSYTDSKTEAKGHSYTSATTAPTCSLEGYTTHTCTACGDSYTDSKTAAKGHSYGATVVAPTCDAEGYTRYVCSDCTYTYLDNRVGATGHTWKDATTSAPKTCTTCGATEGEKLPSTSTTYLNTLSVSYINVGQGDSILIKVDDCDILIDAGTASYGTTVSNYLKSKGVDDIELMINTHPDADHCGGLTQVLKDYKVEAVWAPSRTATSAAYNNFTSAVTSEGLTKKTPSVGTTYSYGGLTLSVLYNGSGASNSNDSSIVTMLEYGNYRFLFTGDISSTIESNLVNSSDLTCDVLKVAHHGSAGSSSSSFLKATAAKYGVICVGNNSYGHPTDTALGNLSSAGISVYRTDKNGNVVFSTNGATLTLPGGSTVSGGSAAGGSGSSGSSSSGSSSSGSGSSSSSDTFIGNKESKVFHLPTCSNLPAVSKRNYLYNYWFIVNCIGYKPCGICLKNYVP